MRDYILEIFAAALQVVVGLHILLNNPGPVLYWAALLWIFFGLMLGFYKKGAWK